MASSDVLNYDVTGSDHTESEAFEQPRPGLYEAKIFAAEVETPEGKDKRLKVTYEVIKGKYKGARLYSYIAFTEEQKWKMDQLLLSVGIDTSKKEKGKLSIKKDLLGKNVVIMVVADEYNGEYKGAHKRTYKWKPLGADDPEEYEEDEDAEEEEEEEEEEWEEEEEEEDDLAELDRNELKALIKEEGLDIKVLKTMDDDALRDAIRAARPEAEEEEEEEEAEEEEEEEEVEDDYDSWTLAKLKEELKSRGLKTTGAQSALIVRLRANDNEPF